jgi:hypothetical protein
MGFDSNLKNAYVKFNIADIKFLCENALKNIDKAVDIEFQRQVTWLVTWKLRKSNNPSILVRLGLQKKTEAITREEAEEILKNEKSILREPIQQNYIKFSNLKTAVENAPYQKMFIDADLYAILKNWADKFKD